MSTQSPDSARITLYLGEALIGQREGQWSVIVVCGGKKQWIASAVGDDPTIQFDTIMAAYETEHSPDGGVVGNN